MPRILLVGVYPPPFGGVASLIRSTARALASAGLEIDILSYSKKTEMDNEFPGVCVIRSGEQRIRQVIRRNIQRILPYWLFLVKAGFDNHSAFRQSLLAAQVEDYAVRGKIAAIGVYSWQRAQFLPMLRRRLPKQIRFAFTFFGAIYANLDEFHTRNTFNQEVLNSANIVMATSQHCARSLMEAGLSHGSLKVIYPGVDTEQYTPLDPISLNSLRDRLGIPSTSVICLYFGQLSRRLGLHTLMSAAPRILYDIPESFIIICGARVDEECYQESINLQNQWPSRILISPDVSEGQKPLYFQACDIFIAPTQDARSCGQISIMEAMACGKPVIASRVGGIPENVKDGEAGLLIDPEDIHQLTSAVIRLVQDHDFAHRLGEGARHLTVNHFSNKIFDQRIIETYRLLVNGNPEVVQGM